MKISHDRLLVALRPRHRGAAVFSLPALALLVALGGCSTTTGTAVNPSPPAAAAGSENSPREARVLEEFGIEIIALRSSAAGRMLDLRFRVLDKDKAMPFFKKELKPYLIDDQTGAVLEVPVPAKGGPMRPTSRDPREGITYFMLFANPGGMIHPGRAVTLAIGDHRIDGLVVE